MRLDGTPSVSVMKPVGKTPSKIANSVTVSIDTLQLWDRNPRSIKTERFKELKARLQRQGQIKPLLVAADGKTVIGGNMRLRAMQELGIAEVWVSQTEATTDKEIFDLALTDNEEFGYYEQEQVAELALELGLTPLELKSYALSLGAPTTLDLVIDKFGPEDVEEDEAPEVDETSPPVSVLGEVYQLGNHRLMCGSATDREDIEKLLGGVTPHLVMTDPPYGIDVVKGGTTDGSAPTKFGAVGGGGKPGKGGYSAEGVAATPKRGSVGASNMVKANMYRQIENDDTTDAARESYEVCQELGFKNYLVWGGNYFTDFVPPSACWVVWDKQNTGNFADVEMAWTSYDKGAKLYSYLWNGLSRAGNRTDELVSRVHPTQKPVGMQQKVLADFTKADDVVLDLFGGSGSLLIACKNTNRTCYMMELDPKYVDVIRKRYHKHVTGDEEGWEQGTPVITEVKEVAYASR